jgi:hypothetical protein
MGGGSDLTRRRSSFNTAEEQFLPTTVKEQSQHKEGAACKLLRGNINWAEELLHTNRGAASRDSVTTSFVFGFNQTFLRIGPNHSGKAPELRRRSCGTSVKD